LDKVKGDLGIDVNILFKFYSIIDFPTTIHNNSHTMITFL